ncbi:MAG TPA: DivIVA domain-containing protein [Vicinamibacterales bacterium]|jgi:cell division initiation protein|nr:DivIVA domain-containing protein [Vicinamibacterales bacterium]
MALTTNEPRPRITSPERNITITPLDMRQARFATGMRGFDKADVNTFLQEAAEGFDHALRENERLRMEIVRLEASLNQFRELEGSLKTTLMSAQKVADDMRENAQQEAARLVREAEGRVELMVQRAQSKTEDIEREIDGLRIKRREAETNLEGTIAALHNTLDFIREQDRREREDRVVQHWPKIAPVAQPARVG